eukprot:COSAG06_NODE_820_length_12102_cov_16.846205_10_plen_150_part_00
MPCLSRACLGASNRYVSFIGGSEEKKRCFPPLPQAMHAHCHAPTCKRVELWNNDTGKLLCRQDPICERRKNLPISLLLQLLTSLVVVYTVPHCPDHVPPMYAALPWQCSAPLPILCCVALTRGNAYCVGTSESVMGFSCCCHLACPVLS